MRIVHVLTRLLRAGSEENTIATCVWQARAGHDVILIHGTDFDPSWYDEDLSGVALQMQAALVHPINVVSDLRAVMALRKAFRTLAPDVIHTHQSKAGILGRIAAMAVPNARVVHGIHIVPFANVGRLKRWLFIAAERLAARRTDLFVAVSQNTAQAYVDAGICPQSKTACVHSGMHLEPFLNAHIPNDWATLVGQKTRPPVVLMLAAFEQRKRHIPFLLSFQDVLDRVPDARLLLAGAGPFESSIRDTVRKLGLEDRVVFCGHRPDPAALIALADLCVLTSEREGLPRVIVQSIAAGCPVVVSDLPGIDEIVQHDVNGLIVDANDMAAVAHTISHVLTDLALRTRLQIGAKATDVSSWQWDALGARTTALYQPAL
jgi:glycosyltransferase involved in cell wall biosynthesis